MKINLFIDKAVIIALIVLFTAACFVMPGVANVEVPAGVTAQTITFTGGKILADSAACKFDYDLKSYSARTTADGEVGYRLAYSGKSGKADFYVYSEKAWTFKLKVRGAQANGNKFNCSVNNVLKGENIRLDGSKNSDIAGESVFVDYEIGLIELNAGNNVITINSVDPIENGVTKYKGFHVVISSVELVPIHKIGTKADNGKQKIVFEAEESDSIENYVITELDRTFEVNCEKEGDYFFSVFFQGQYSNADNKIIFELNDSDIYEIDCQCCGYSSDNNNPSKFAAASVKLHLLKGSNTINVTSPVLAIDKFELTNYDISFANNFELSEFSVVLSDMVYQNSPKIYSAKVYDEIPYRENSGDVEVLWSDGESEKTRLFVLAGYDEKNELKIIKVIEKGCTGYNKTDLIEFDNVSFEDIYRLKVFIFNDFEKLTPLSEARLVRKYPTKKYVTTDICPNLSRLNITSYENIKHRDMGGDNGQATYAIAMSPFDNNLVIKATDTVGIWRTDDGGESWENTSVGLIYPYTNDVVFDPVNEGVVYLVNAGSSGAVTKGYEDMGIYKSTDNGMTWSQDLYAKYTLTALGGRKQLFVQNSGSCSYLYAATMGSGIYRKDLLNANSHWEQIYKGGEVFYDIYADDSGMIFAVAENKLIKSLDNGDSWSDVSVKVDGESIVLRSIAVYPTNKNLIFGVDTTKLYKSEDGGETWSLIKEYLSGIQEFVNVKFIDYISPSSENYRMYFCMRKISASLRYSDDFGQNGLEIPVYYDEYGNRITQEEYWAMSFAYDPDTQCICYMKDGLAYSYNGGNTFITKAPNGLAGFPMTDISFYGDGAVAYIAYIDGGLYRSEAGNEAGELYPTIEVSPYIRHDGSKSAFAVELDPNNSDHVLSITGSWGTGKTAIIQSFDGGETWSKVTNAEGEEISNDKGIAFLKYNPANSNVIFASNLRSDDNGATWKELNMPVEGDNPATDAVETDKTAIICDVSKTGKLLAYCKNGWTGNVYISEDLGESWTAHKPTGFSAGRAIFDTSDDNYLWLDGFNRIFKYNITDGVSKQKGNNDISFWAVQAIAQNPNNPNHLLVIKRDDATFKVEASNIYETVDGGETWNSLVGYQGIFYANSVVFHPTQPLVYIGTYTGTLVYEY